MKQLLAARVELVGVQILRGIAVSLVVLHHSLEESLASAIPPTSPDWLLTFGASGVDIFFVISGFIMVHTSFPRGRDPIRPINFVIKRVSRIYPFYWICVFVALALWSVGLFGKLDPTFWSVTRSLLLVPPPPDKPIITVSWSLVYEMYFYAIFAGALFLKSRRASTLMVTGVVGAIVCLGNLIAEKDDFFLSFLSDPIVLEFCFGMFLAYTLYHLQLPGWLAQYGWLFGFAMFCLVSLYVADVTKPSSSVRWAAYGIPALMVVASFLGIVSAHSRLQRWFVLLGDASYAIYLTHPFVMVAYAKVLKDHSSLTAISQLPFVPLVFLISLAGGIIAHALIERPLIDLFRKYLVEPNRASEKAT